MKLPALDFSSPNNAASSLSVLAEHVRRGDLKCIVVKQTIDGVALGISTPNSDMETETGWAT